MTDRTRRRIATVMLAPVAALIGWAAIRVASVDLVVNATPGTVGPADVEARNYPAWSTVERACVS